MVIYSICVTTSLPDFNRNYNVIYDAYDASTIHLLWFYFLSHESWFRNKYVTIGPVLAQKAAFNRPDSILLLGPSSLVADLPCQSFIVEKTIESKYKISKKKKLKQICKKHYVKAAKQNDTCFNAYKAFLDFIQYTR